MLQGADIDGAVVTGELQSFRVAPPHQSGNALGFFDRYRLIRETAQLPDSVGIISQFKDGVPGAVGLLVAPIDADGDGTVLDDDRSAVLLGRNRFHGATVGKLSEKVNPPRFQTSS